jgi:histidinol dehydrogenase
VTEAKRQVFGVCGIDGSGRPVRSAGRLRRARAARVRRRRADRAGRARSARPRGRGVARPQHVLEAVAALLTGDFARETGRGEIVQRVLAERTWLIHAGKRERRCSRSSSAFAPEHLSLQVADPWSLVPRIRRAGAIFIGDHTPVAAGDYIAGTNHTLPTSGASRFASGLRTADYYRTMSVVENSAATDGRRRRDAGRARRVRRAARARAHGAHANRAPIANRSFR